MVLRATVAVLLVVAPGAATGAFARERARSSCVECHSKLEERLRIPVDKWDEDVHAEARLDCVGCHGGDPSSDVADDAERAMSPKKGFLPVPDRVAIPEFCGRCHSDLTYMRRFNPQARVDQLVEYRTSKHGIRNAAGDPVPATCIDCHGAHGVLPVSSPKSPVHAVNVPATCARCHADEEKMSGYGQPTNQLALYRESVHGRALLERGDTAAPACNDCHGNHGAAPPGIHSVANVCGHCHAHQAKLFRDSFKNDLFAELGVSECSECHGSHLVLHPTPALFYGGSEPTVSRGEVESAAPLEVRLGRMEPGDTAEVRWGVALALHDGPEGRGFDHAVGVEADSGGFAIDATVFPGAQLSDAEPRRNAVEGLRGELRVASISGEPVRAGDALLFELTLTADSSSDVRVRDRPGRSVFGLEGSVCLRCHEPGDACDQATGRMYEALVSMDRELREADALLHRAEVAGMEVSEARFRMASEGRTAMIEARALIHSFDPERLIARSEEGREVAEAALRVGEAAMREIQYRRRGLAISLILIAAVLLALFLKIRQVDRRRQAT